MMSDAMITVPALIIVTLLGFALVNIWLQRRYPINLSPLVKTIDAVLPQTQCAQCGFPGCQPYAKAIAEQGEEINLCPPGGQATYTAIAAIMAVDTSTPPLPAAEVGIAYIDESQCIGCTLCLPPCPVDAIVGAQGYMHTVVPIECTGCELCIPACPVDCISMQLPSVIKTKPRRPRHHESEIYRACLQCNLCNPVCPVHLPAAQLLKAVNDHHNDLGDLAVAYGLMDCIDCGLCDRACPSDIPLAQIFHGAKSAWSVVKEQRSNQNRMKRRFEDHQQRLTQDAELADSKRQARLSSKRTWS